MKTNAEHDYDNAMAAYCAAMGDAWQTRLPCPRKAEADGEATPERLPESRDDILDEHFDPDDPGMGFVPEGRA